MKTLPAFHGVSPSFKKCYNGKKRIEQVQSGNELYGVMHRGLVAKVKRLSDSVRFNHYH